MSIRALKKHGSLSGALATVASEGSRMRCFARWHEDEQRGIFFRDQTILQFGDSWNLVASLVLLNPGSAVPLGVPKTEELRKMELPYFIEPSDGEHYYEFRLDPLMRNVLGAFSKIFAGGAVKIYNAFNLKNKDSKEALLQLTGLFGHPSLLDDKQNIVFLSAPVIFGPGMSAANNPLLRRQLQKYIDLAGDEVRYGIQRIGHRRFAAIRVNPDRALYSYHPSYSFTRGNSTSFSEISQSIGAWRDKL